MCGLILVCYTYMLLWGYNCSALCWLILMGKQKCLWVCYDTVYAMNLIKARFNYRYGRPMTIDSPTVSLLKKTFLYTEMWFDTYSICQWIILEFSLSDTINLLMTKPFFALRTAIFLFLSPHILSTTTFIFYDIAIWGLTFVEWVEHFLAIIFWNILYNLVFNIYTFLTCILLYMYLLYTIHL